MQFWVFYSCNQKYWFIACVLKSYVAAASEDRWEGYPPRHVFPGHTRQNSIDLQ